MGRSKCCNKNIGKGLWGKRDTEKGQVKIKGWSWPALVGENYDVQTNKQKD